MGSLRPTIDSETLSEDPKRVFQFVKDKISGMNGDEIFIQINCPLVLLNKLWGSLARVSESVVGLKQPTRA